MSKRDTRPHVVDHTCHAPESRGSQSASGQGLVPRRRDPSAVSGATRSRTPKPAPTKVRDHPLYPFSPPPQVPDLPACPFSAPPKASHLRTRPASRAPHVADLVPHPPRPPAKVQYLPPRPFSAPPKVLNLPLHPPPVPPKVFFLPAELFHATGPSDGRQAQVRADSNYPPRLQGQS